MDYSTFDLQLFADGDGGQGAEAGVSTVDAGQKDTLLKLGVPEDKILRQQKNAARTLPAGAISTLPPPGDGKRPRWEDIMSDPEYNRKMQDIVQSRLKKSKDAEDALTALRPALDTLAKRYGLPDGESDYAALAKAVTGESRSAQINQGESGKNPEAPDTGARRMQGHVARLAREAEALREVFPNFDFTAEMKNPAFARMTSPTVGVSLEDAYYAVHRKELQTAAMQVTAQKAAEKLSNSIRSGSMRPQEAGSGSQAPSSLVFDYRKATPAQREELKQRIREAAARGEKIYPGNRR